MRKALVVGIDFYEDANALYGCVDDAYRVKSMLERHGDGTVNFGVEILTGTGPNDHVNRHQLRANIQELFRGDPEIALFYFAGHGHIETAGGYLVCSDSKTGDDGIAISEILTWADKSNARNRIIILDSCHSGTAGDRPSQESVSEVKEGTTILTACTKEQYASEENCGGVFTTLMVDALGGAAANLLGHISPGSVYAHIDQSLGSWAQRPVFKTNVKEFVSLRNVPPQIPLSDLRRIVEFFPTGTEFGLDPTFEPERGIGHAPEIPAPNAENTAKFAILQRYNRVNLVKPVGAPHMWHAAMESKSCRLTVLGEHYRKLVARGLI